MSLEEVWHKAGEGYSEAVTEFHIVGGLHPELTLDWYCQMLRGLKQRFPQVHLKAFTMVEIGYFAQRGKISEREVLQRLKDAGMDSLPGGGAEIFHDRVRRIICDHKLTGQQWIDTARIAHQMGLHSNCTMLYGHIETEEDRLDHLLRLRELQDETRGFQTFIPLAFHPDNTALDHISKTTGFDDIREIAVSRLMLDNISHIKAYWVMMTPRIAQIAQRFGADDLDGTLVEERIYHDAGATTSQNLRRGELMRLITRGRTRAGGTRYAVSARGALRERVYGSRVAASSFAASFSVRELARPPANGAVPALHASTRQSDPAGHWTPEAPCEALGCESRRLPVRPAHAGIGGEAHLHVAALQSVGGAGRVGRQHEDGSLAAVLDLQAAALRQRARVPADHQLAGFLAERQGDRQMRQHGTQVGKRTRGNRQ